MKYIDVVVDNKSRATDAYYTYICRDDSVRIGQKVYLTFGKGKTVRAGYVFGISDTYDGGYALKEIEGIDENVCLGEEIVRTCIWMKRRYLIRYIDAVNCFTPPEGSVSARFREKEPVEKSESAKALTQEQKKAVDIISSAIDKGERNIFLLHGVTSSGKTEVYMQAIDRAVSAGKTAIMMVPEVALTEEIIARFERRFGSEQIAVIHYRKNRSYRINTWNQIASGKKRIVIGARSAVFAPLENIGIIIMDEEHEMTYKSDMTPKYDTVDVAVRRAGEYGAAVVLGSATPSVVSYSRAQEGIYTKIQLKKRYNENLLPSVEMADMGQERRDGNHTMFSRKLYDRINENLKESRQVMLLLNRRGFSTYLSCDSCGYVMKCPDCGISLTYHKDIDKARCHYCGRTFQAVKKCPDCGGVLTYRGSGTQKLEEEVSTLFPDASYARLDFDVAGKKGAAQKVLDDFRKRKTDILIGTQMIAKGLDFDNVGIVGIMSADNELNIPDYRSPERTFQLITQAAGRAGRGDFRGSVVIQSFMCDNYAVKYAAANDYEGFCREELEIRRKLDYPPYTDIIRLIFTGGDEKKVQACAEEFYSCIKSDINGITAFRPAAAPMAKVKETYRYHLLIKCPKGMRSRYLAVIDRHINRCADRKTGIVVDINPYSFI